MPISSKRRPFRPAPIAALDEPRGGPTPQGVTPVPTAQWPDAHDPVWQLVGLSAEKTLALAASLDANAFLYFPGLPDYETARSGEDEWPTPRIIAYCATEADVATCLQFVRDNDWLVSIRSGGHNSAGYHLCNGMVIDMSQMVAVSTLPDATSVRVQAAVNFETLDEHLRTADFAVPGGTCANVCCAGYYLGGGYSLASRTFGMGCDAVQSMRVMLASGEIVEVSRTSHTDLYWAMLGGSGGQYGIVLEYVLEGRQPDSFFGFLAAWPLSTAVDVLEVLESKHTFDGKTAKSEKFGYLGCFSNLVGGDPVANKGAGPVDPDPSFAVLGMYHGTQAQALAELADVFAVGTPTLRYQKQAKYSVINTELFYFLPYVALRLDQALGVAASGLVDPTSSPDWAGIVAQVQKSPNPGNLIAFEPYGGAIAVDDTGANSYPHRLQKLDLLFDSFWSETWQYNKDRPSAQQWLDETRAVVADALNGRTYVNYAERNLVDYRQQYWAESFDRLLAIKQQYDPTNVFRFDQSIRWSPGMGDTHPPA